MNPTLTRACALYIGEGMCLRCGCGGYLIRDVSICLSCVGKEVRSWKSKYFQAAAKRDAALAQVEQLEADLKMVQETLGDQINQQIDGRRWERERADAAEAQLRKKR